MKANRNAREFLLGIFGYANTARPHVWRLAIVFAAAFNVAACGLQTDTITISYVPQGSAKALPGASGTVVDVQVEDLRSNKSEVSKKGDEYEILAPILIENDVAEILKGAIETELKNRGFDVGDGGPVVVAELSKFYNRFRAGNSEAEVFIHVQVKKAEGGLVYSEIVAGKGINPDVFMRSGENAKIALEAAMQDVVNKLMTNVEFLDAIIEASKS
jgi:uncharacterized lipoprotein